MRLPETRRQGSCDDDSSNWNFTHIRKWRSRVGEDGMMVGHESNSTTRGKRTDDDDLNASTRLYCPRMLLVLRTGIPIPIIIVDSIALCISIVSKCN